MRDLGSEARPYICEIPIKDAYKIVNETRPIGKIYWKEFLNLMELCKILIWKDYGLPSTIEVRFIPRGPKIIEQPSDLEFGKLDPTVLGSTYQQMKNEIIVTLKCLADGYPIPQYE